MLEKYRGEHLNSFQNFFFEIKESKITRGHNYTLLKKQSRLVVRKYSFSQRTINVWNNLSYGAKRLPGAKRPSHLTTNLRMPVGPSHD